MRSRRCGATLAGVRAGQRSANAVPRRCSRRSNMALVAFLQNAICSSSIACAHLGLRGREKKNNKKKVQVVVGVVLDIELRTAAGLLLQLTHARRVIWRVREAALKS